MNRAKCIACGQPNTSDRDVCHGCGAGLLQVEFRVERSSVPVPGRHHFGRWARWTLRLLTLIAIILIGAYASLLFSSDALNATQRQTVMNAVSALEDSGFASEAFVLRHVVSYRTSDNWWNRYVGHRTAYAATNFPFGVVTLYPTFFKSLGDDTERATILLHELSHVFGMREGEALQTVWSAKGKLGWTSVHYSHTQLWKNTRDWTAGNVPALFKCGEDRRSDCAE